MITSLQRIQILQDQRREELGHDGRRKVEDLGAVRASRQRLRRRRTLARVLPVLHRHSGWSHQGQLWSQSREVIPFWLGPMSKDWLGWNKCKLF